MSSDSSKRKRFSSKEKLKRALENKASKEVDKKVAPKKVAKKPATPKKPVEKAPVTQIRPMQLVTDQEMVGSATMFMRWSVDPKIIESLEKSGVLDSALILINVAQAGIIDRTIDGDKPFQKFRKPEVIVAKLTDVGVYIQFKSPGRHFVVATIVTAYRGYYDPLDKHNTANVIKRLVEGKTDIMSDYAPEENIRLQTVFDMDTLVRYVNTGCVFKVGFFPIKGNGSGVNWWGDVSSKNLYYQAAFLSVDVDPALFADKPRDWVWLNWRRENKPIDQCQARSRRLYAYTLQPIIWLVVMTFCLSAYSAQIALNIVVVLVIKFGFLSRSRIEWRSVFNLAGQISDTGFIDRNGNEVKNPIDRSIFITDRKGYSRPRWLSFFAPIYCVPTMATFVIANTFEPIMPFLYWVLTVIGGLLLFVTLIDPLVDELMDEWRAFQRHINSAPNNGNQPAKPIEPVQSAPPVINPLIRQALTSELSSADVRLSAIPRPAQTVWLRFTDLKRVVCKPFAG